MHLLITIKNKNLKGIPKTYWFQTFCYMDLLDGSIVFDILNYIFNCHNHSNYAL